MIISKTNRTNREQPELYNHIVAKVIKIRMPTTRKEKEI